MAETYSLIKMLYMYIYIYILYVYICMIGQLHNRGHVKLFER